jgi:pyruvate/oxaloacetate carboxyltransferase
MTNGSNHESKVFLNDESLERLKRLKAKITKIDEVAIIALALKGLEEKADSIIRRRVIRRIRALKNKGIDPGQIADHLNSKGYPPIEGKHQWDGENISMLLNE